MVEDIHQLLDGKWDDGRRPKDIYSRLVAKKPSAYVDAIVSGLQSKTRRIQNGCAELASLLSEEEPGLLYPHFSVFKKGLGAKEAVLRWEAVCTIGNLASVDEKRKTPSCIPLTTPFLHDKSIVLQGHSVRALAKIATAYPSKAPEILRALIDASPEFPGNRIGYVVEAMGAFVSHESLRQEIRDFVTPHASSEVKSVVAKAKKVLKKLPA